MSPDDKMLCEWVKKVGGKTGLTGLINDVLTWSSWGWPYLTMTHTALKHQKLRKFWLNTLSDTLVSCFDHALTHQAKAYQL